MPSTNFAAIDIGSYNVSMEIFALSPGRGLKSLTRVRSRLELGKDTFSYGRLSMEKLNELSRILLGYNRIMKEYAVSAYRCCAKSAFREARNRIYAVSHVQRLTGIRVEVLSNSEQRFIGYKSIASRGEEFQRFIEKPTAIIDVGGGSLQISLFDRDSLVTTQNIRLGSLRIREQLAPFEHGEVHAERLVDELINRDVLSFKHIYLGEKKIDNIILVGDYFTNLIFQNKSDVNKVETRGEFLEWYQKIVGSTEREIAATLDAPPEITSVLVPMAVLYKKLIEELGAETIWLPGIQLTDGIAYDYGIRAKLIPAGHRFDKDILSSARNIAARYGCNAAHTSLVTACADALFKALGKTYQMDARARLLLRVACALYDCGRYVSLVRIGECSCDIIRTTEIIGLSDRERNVIAGIVRLVYGLEPISGDDRGERLAEEELILAARLAAILRLADRLDASFLQKVKDISVLRKEKKLTVTVFAAEDLTLEAGLFAAETDFFEEIYNLKPVLKVKAAAKPAHKGKGSDGGKKA